MKEGKETIALLPVMAFGAPGMGRALTRSVCPVNHRNVCKVEIFRGKLGHSPKAFPAHSLLKFHPKFPTPSPKNVLTGLYSFRFKQLGISK